VDKCRNNQEARRYFLKRSEEVPNQPESTAQSRAETYDDYRSIDVRHWKRNGWLAPHQSFLVFFTEVAWGNNRRSHASESTEGDLPVAEQEGKVRKEGEEGRKGFVAPTRVRVSGQ